MPASSAATRAPLGLLLALLALPVLTGCGDDDTTRSFGLNRDRGDEMRVRALPPLSAPPTLTQRPARAGASEREADSGRPGAAANPNPSSSGEASLLQAAGPAAPGNTRARVAQEAQLDIGNPGMTERLLFGPQGPSAGAAPVIQRGGSKSWLDLF